MLFRSSEKEKQIPYANTYIWNLKKQNASEELRSRTGIKNIENGLEDMGRGKGKLGQTERVAWTYLHYQT